MEDFEFFSTKIHSKLKKFSKEVKRPLNIGRLKSMAISLNKFKFMDNKNYLKNSKTIKILIKVTKMKKYFD